LTVQDLLELSGIQEHGKDAVEAALQAQQLILGVVQKQIFIQSIGDSLLIAGIITFFSCIPLFFLNKKGFQSYNPSSWNFSQAELKKAALALSERYRTGQTPYLRNPQDRYAYLLTPLPLQPKAALQRVFQEIRNLSFTKPCLISAQVLELLGKRRKKPGTA
jgi:hypothetical protein